MKFYADSKWNPHPLSKFIVLLLYGYTVLHPPNEIFSFIFILFYVFFFALNKRIKQGINIFIAYIILYFIVHTTKFYNDNVIITNFAIIFICFKMLLLPYVAGKFFITTTDVGSMLSFMDSLKVPESFSIPIAVIFRFFPYYREEKKDIRRAMRLRGISKKNPIKYLEYISVPTIIMASNAADDIALSAEVRCIRSSVKKERYLQLKFKLVDLFFLTALIGIFVGGILWR